MRIAIVLLVLVGLAIPRPASSQVSTTPVPLTPQIDTGLPLSDLDDLTRLYNAGQWVELQDRAQSALYTASAIAAGLPNYGELLEGLDFHSNYIVLVWIGSDPFGKSMLARVVVHAPASTEPFFADLPGVGARAADPRVFEVFLGRGPRGKLVSVYASSRDKDPLADQLPAFIQAIASPLFAMFGAFAAPPGSPAEAAPVLPPPSVVATVRRVGLPFSRATIKWKASAKEPTRVDDFRDAVDGFVRDLTFTDVPGSACGRVFANAIGAALRTAIGQAACAGPAATDVSCRTAFDAGLQAAEANALLNPVCTGAAKDDVKDAQALDAKARAFTLVSITAAADAELTFKNRPLTHWALGAGSGVLTGARLSLPRVTVGDDGLLAADPLSRVVMTAFVNWSPAGYDAESDSISGAERVRPFFGATLTPDFGVTAGVNVLIAHGIGITASGVVMFAKGASQEEIGKAPANSDKPYALSYARGFVLGISYNFK